MIRCDTDAERKALAELLWAVKDVLLETKRPKPSVVALGVSLDRLFDAGKGEDLLCHITVD